MSISRARIKRTLKLEDKVRKKSVEYRDKVGLKPIPDDYYEYFKLCRVKSDGSIKYVNLYDYQKTVVDTILDSRLTTILKHRQGGISMTLTLLSVWLGRKGGHRAVFLANRYEDAMSLGKRIRFTLNLLEEDGFIKLHSDSLSYFEYETSSGFTSTIDLASQSSGAVSLDGVSYLVLDEVSLYPSLNTTLSYALPTTETVTNPHIVLCGTPRSQVSDFFERVKDMCPNILDKVERIEADLESPLQVIRRGNNSLILNSYKAHPKFGKVKNFLQTKVEEGFGTLEMVRREFGLIFSNSLDSYFDISLVDTLSEPYKLPKSVDDLYYFGLDCSTNSNKDHTVLSVIRGTYDEQNDNTMFILEELLRFNNCTYNQALYKIKEFISQYNQRFVITIESNSLGKLYIDSIKSMGLFGENSVIESNVNSSNRESLIERIKLITEIGKLKLNPDIKHHKYLVSELLSFNMDGSQNKNDDIVFSLAHNLVGVSKFGDISI